MAISHIKSLAMADFTGTVTVFNSQGSTTTVAATDLLRPSDWDSVHNQFLTLSGNTLGGSTLSGTNIVLAGGNNISLSKVNDTRFDIVGVNTVAQTVQTQNMIAASLSGNSTSAGGGYILMSSGTMILAGGNNITLSQNGMSVTISAANTVAQSTNLAAASIGGNSTSAGAGYSNITSGTVFLMGGNNITLSQNGASVTISAFNQTTQTQTHNLTIGGNSTSAGAGYIQISTGTALLAGGNNITLSQNGASITISAFNQTVQTQTHNVTLGGNSTSAGAGYIQISTGTMLLAGGNNITLSQNGASITISAANTVAQTNQTLGIYASSQTMGQSSSSTVDARSFTFVGSGIISLGMSAGSLIISAPAGGGAAGAAISIGGNSTSAGAGYSNITSGTAVLMGGPNITLSQNGASISISAAAPGGGVTRSGYNLYADLPFVVGQQGQGTLIIDPEDVPHMQFDAVGVYIHNTNSSNSSGSHTISYWIGVYTRNVSTLSLMHSTSFSTAVTHSGTAGSYSRYSGLRMWTAPWTSTFTEGQYWVAQLSRTTSGGANGSYSQALVSQNNSAYSGIFGTSHNTTMQWTQGQGVYTATTNAMPASIAFTQIRGSDSMNFRPPKLGFHSALL